MNPRDLNGYLRVTIGDKRYFVVPDGRSCALRARDGSIYQNLRFAAESDALEYASHAPQEKA
jgi:hypothetical protein